MFPITWNGCRPPGMKYRSYLFAIQERFIFIYLTSFFKYAKIVFMKECNGSGRSSLCSTRTVHKHCECGEPMDVTSAYCGFCILEHQGISIHNSKDYIRKTMDHTSDEFGYESDYIGHSSFNHLDWTPTGIIDQNLSMRKMDVLRWNSKQRAKVQRDEPLEDELE